MEPKKRIELLNLNITNVALYQLSYFGVSGGLGGVRSHNLKIKNLLLYQLSYQPKKMAEAVRFELTEAFRPLRFSRPTP
jgi:hypothetical protein